jgi:hypothetical protein
VAAVVRVEGGEAHEAVDAGLGLQVPVGVLARDAHGGRLDAGFLAELPVHDLRLVVALLRPAKVHAQKHLGPVLRLGTSGARVDGEESVPGVVLPGEHQGNFQALEQLRKTRKRRLEVLPRVFPLAQELQVGRGVLVRPLDRFVKIQLPPGAGALLPQRLALLRVGPVFGI